MPEDDPRTVATRRALVDATIETIRLRGIGAVSARTVASVGKVNQALVFYHFGSVQNLVAEACRVTTAEQVDRLKPQLESVSTLVELVAVARVVQERQRAEGNVTVLAQTLAAAHHQEELAAAVGESLRLWTAPLEAALARVLATSPLREVIDARALADLVSAAFVGLELVEPVGLGEGTEASLDRLEKVAAVLDGLGPVARRAVRSTLRRG